ncbi:thiol-disulfide oxidoreductase DCC family protein [Faecalibacter macacae]|uniref:Thiol-disulfide oxidoreductase DCC family protein n=1 Tax=Faecalibacter macacae TaxID=1859289 RepID=A0A3L9M3F5_9FLAO|nr:thiol-disulfide oxidoreductase DCC family protein [Faecalibacter macacae]RLZ07545.1 thiol-disulfide oxidoreductase DCC family protein [Faecalibacter macacae]
MKTKKIILFDGVCNLCNSSVQFIIERDTKNVFLFSSLQSDFGQKILKENNLNEENFDSIILIDEDKIYQKSDAALRIAKELQSPIKYFNLFLILPQFLRDFGYDLIAKNRYKFFGKQESCWIPTEELKNKFLN